MHYVRIPRLHTISPSTMTSPKQPLDTARRDWYPYYAGYTERFVVTTLSTYLHDANSILDTWSGSGTTTAACLKRGIRSVGIDLNPALTVIARARLTPQSTRESLQPIGKQIQENAKQLNPHQLPGDILAIWFRHSAVNRVRQIQGAIHKLLVADSGPTESTVVIKPDSLPLLACFFYSALFASVRDLLYRFRSTNPMWLCEAQTYRHRIDPDWDALWHAFARRILDLGNRLSLTGEEILGTASPFITGCATALPFGDDEFDGAITSPPYATRIDYVKGTLPELAVLGARPRIISQLREGATGSPVVSGSTKPSVGDLLSPYARRLVNRIEIHSSKGSRSYYAPWMRNYLVNLQLGLKEIDRTVARNGRIAVVIQDSFYKEVHVDMQRVVQEAMHEYGRTLVHRRDYPAKNLRSRMNPRACSHLSTRENCESLLVF